MDKNRQKARWLEERGPINNIGGSKANMKRTQREQDLHQTPPRGEDDFSSRQGTSASAEGSFLAQIQASAVALSI